MQNIMQAIERLAQTNPQLALALMRSNVSQPQIYTMKATFASGAPDQPVNTQFDSPVTSDFWVYDIAYTLDMPKAFEGSIFRGQQLIANAQLPGIRAQLSVNGGVGLPWLMSQDFTPIELLARCAVGGNVGPQYGDCNPFLMFFPQTVKGTFVLTRQYDDSEDGVGEIPAILTIAFSGLTLAPKSFGDLTHAQARAVLADEYKIGTDGSSARVVTHR